MEFLYWLRLGLKKLKKLKKLKIRYRIKTKSLFMSYFKTFGEIKQFYQI
jgi:hypothetical protein